MPRGANANSKKNLNKGRFNTETAVEANKKSQESKKVLKSFREMDLELTTPEEREEMLANLKRMAKRNLRALELYMKMTGEKLDEKVVEVKNVNPYESLTTAELKKLVDDD